MPKRIEEIRNFHAGVISTPDESDIPLDASPYSQNIEPISVDGRLEGIPADAEKVSSVSADAMKKINNDGTYHVVYYDHSATKFKKIDDLHGTSTPSTGNLSSSNETSVSSPTMVVNNKEVHIGTGHANAPKWAGFIENDQFASTAPTTMQIADAKLVSPSAFPDIVKFVEKSGYLYGVEWQGTHVYKFKLSDNSYAGKSQTTFAKTKSISLSGDGSHLWVLDEISNASHVHKVDLDDMLSEHSNQVDSGNKITDIKVCNSYMWFNFNQDDTDGNALNKIKNTLESNLVAGGSFSVTDRTPKRNPIEALTKSWCYDSGAGINPLDVEYTVPRIALVDLATTTGIGWIAEVVQESGGNAPSYKYGSTTSTIVAVRYVIMLVSNTQDASSNAGPQAVYRLDTNNDFVGSGNMLYSVSSTGGATYLTYGNEARTSNTSVVSLGSLDADNITNRNDDVAISSSNTSAIEVKGAYYLKHSSDSNQSAFEANGTGRWTNGSAISNQSGVLESNVNIAFDETAVDYGAGSTTANSKIGFTTTSTQFYKISFIYDGYQEGPLSDEFKFQGIATAGKGVKVTIQLRNLAQINRRVSHIALYRADADNRNDSVEPQGFYRLIKISKLDTTWSPVTESASLWSDYRRKIFEDNNTAGASYDARVGISEILTDITPNYELSTSLNNTHFIANIKQETLGHLSNYVLKSKPLKFNQFNYIEDFLALPSKPTALAGFNGRLYAFDENNTYRIEPNSFYVEDVYEGVGCKNKDCVIVTEYGMFIADKNNIYRHNGQQPQPIGNAILKGGTALDRQDYATPRSYHLLSTRDYCKMAFDGVRNAVLVFGETHVNISSTDYYYYWCWAYSLSKGRWDIWQISEDNGATNGTQKPRSFLSGKNGEVFFSDGTKLKHYTGHASSKRNWEWKSKEMSANMDSVSKNWIDIFISGTPNVNTGAGDVKVYIDGGDPDPNGTDSVGVPLANNIFDKSNAKKISIPKASRTGKKCRIELANQTGRVDSIGFIFRPIGVTDGNV